MATTTAAAAGLWDHLIGHVAQRARWRWPLAAEDEPLLHMLADPRAVTVRLDDALYLRAVDLPARARRADVRRAGRRRARGRGRRLPVERRALAAGRRRVGATCEPTGGRRADLALGARELGAAYLGGTTLAALAAAGRVEERTPGRARRGEHRLRRRRARRGASRTSSRRRARNASSAATPAWSASAPIRTATLSTPTSSMTRSPKTPIRIARPASVSMPPSNGGGGAVSAAPAAATRGAGRSRHAARSARARWRCPGLAPALRVRCGLRAGQRRHLGREPGQVLVRAQRELGGARLRSPAAAARATAASIAWSRSVERHVVGHVGVP